jgi:glucose-6-phosphate dehydrogenase assembly protein OpcA
MPATATLDPEQILHELSQLWTSMAKQPEDASGVLRACALTLLVLAEESDDPAAIGETLGALMQEHPSRAIVIRARASGEKMLSSRVFAQCWLPFGHRRQICSEQVEITVSSDHLEEVAAIVLPLIVPDLPAVLWCRAPDLLAQSGFPRLAGLVHKLVFDSAKLPDPGVTLRSLSGQPTILGDLAWTRLTPWRERIAQAFEGRLDSLARIERVDVTFSCEEAGMSCRYLAAWLRNAFERAGASPELTLERRERNSVRFSGAGLAEALEVQDPQPDSPGDYGLMREELSLVHRDPVFERALQGVLRPAAR